MRWLLSLTLTLFLIITPVAQADFIPSDITGPFTNITVQMTSYLNAAKTHWGRQQGCAAGETTQVYTASQLGDANWDAESRVDGCNIWLLPATLTHGSRYQICLLITHEWGHTTGLGHSSDPRNIMYSGLITTGALECNKFLLRGGHRNHHWHR